jgi:septum formation protein
MMSELPLMNDLPRAELPGFQTGKPEPLILASGSPRRAQLLAAAGYEFSIQPASESAECGICSRETAPQMVARLAYRKAADVIARIDDGLVLAADTVASCVGNILGKPHNRDHAEEMLRLLSGRDHDVYTGVCFWSRRNEKFVVDVVRTRLRMAELSEEQLNEHLDSLRWEGKAGAFGYQDGNDWLTVIGNDSESNVVGLPMERLAELLENFEQNAEKITTPTTDSIESSDSNCS